MTKHEKEKMKAILYERQGGCCAAPCEDGRQGRWIPPDLSDLMVLDHIKAQKHNGPDTIENLQLLCWHCNCVKRAEPPEYLDNYHRKKWEQLTIFSSEGVVKRQVVRRSEPQRQHRPRDRGSGLVACMAGFLLSRY